MRKCTVSQWLLSKYSLFLESSVFSSCLSATSITCILSLMVLLFFESKLDGTTILTLPALKNCPGRLWCICHPFYPGHESAYNSTYISFRDEQSPPLALLVNDPLFSPLLIHSIVYGGINWIIILTNHMNQFLMILSSVKYLKRRNMKNDFSNLSQTLHQTTLPTIL